MSELVVDLGRLQLEVVVETEMENLRVCAPVRSLTTGVRVQIGGQPATVPVTLVLTEQVVELIKLAIEKGNWIQS